MIFKAKAPLRLGLAGGGTDVSPYSDIYNGAIINATISLFANCTIETTNTGLITIKAHHQKEALVLSNSPSLPIDGCLDLAKGVYNCLQQDFPFKHNGLIITTSVDAPLGSGLGTSSTLVVAILGAFVQMQNLQFSKYELAAYAYKVERNYLNFAGGKQDQYAAVFGGINYMKFLDNDRAEVEPILLSNHKIEHLQGNLLLYYTESFRDSSVIIKEQQLNVINKVTNSIEAMHKLKQQANDLKEVLLFGELDEIGKILQTGFSFKQQMAKNIATPSIIKFYETAIQAGATGGKISGAGGGGFMFFYCPNNTKDSVTKALSILGGNKQPFTFTANGLLSWTETN